ncbi:sigma-70 family RNA polymerase sigma factor [Flavivirga aquimarina]|uniref:Sigma-70 family RNA polymerase sigma factor n=1 Tax=Flavivirga aquimarina TaxID=2027862 RepID=A0ABT8W9T5_9FLAO|nr:sigma-70 family RNA polymerase sigma factor [Flavivirga aquimarina]MDO5969856.1 sigma-70 family RNA polymerase sigma factor [Flavivirga aquimarina]
MFNNEKKIVDELRKGNKKAYEHIYLTYFDDLVLYCFNLTGRLPLAKDIVQNVMLKIWQNKHSLNIHSSLKSYLYRSVYNTFATAYSKKVKEEKVLFEYKNETLINMINSVNDDTFKEKLNLIEQAIEQLPERQKEVFLLNKKENYRYKEIANQLGITEKTVEKHISRSIAKIKKILVSKNTGFFMLIFMRIKKQIRVYSCI